MRLPDVLKKGVFAQKQHAGQGMDGPLGPVLREISAVYPLGNNQPSQAISPVGIDLARIISKYDLWILFINTDGSGIAPWRRLIVLDSDYRGKGQIETPSRIGMVVHELTHLVQRELKGSHYWPGGGFNPVRGRRWIGDSTNYMEVLAYLVGWTVEYDLTKTKQFDPNISLEQRARNEVVLDTIRERLAYFTATDKRSSSRKISELFPDNPVYKQNARIEARYLDHRIPPGTWHDWLRRMGFSRSAVDHIMILAAQGEFSRSDLRI
jgi:hypothetical protein